MRQTRSGLHGVARPRRIGTIAIVMNFNHIEGKTIVRGGVRNGFIRIIVRLMHVPEKAVTNRNLTLREGRPSDTGKNGQKKNDTADFAHGISELAIGAKNPVTHGNLLLKGMKSAFPAWVH